MAGRRERMGSKLGSAGEYMGLKEDPERSGAPDPETGSRKVDWMLVIAPVILASSIWQSRGPALALLFFVAFAPVVLDELAEARGWQWAPALPVWWGPLASFVAIFALTAAFFGDASLWICAAGAAVVTAIGTVAWLRQRAAAS